MDTPMMQTTGQLGTALTQKQQNLLTTVSLLLCESIYGLHDMYQCDCSVRQTWLLCLHSHAATALQGPNGVSHAAQ